MERWSLKQWVEIETPICQGQECEDKPTGDEKGASSEKRGEQKLVRHNNWSLDSGIWKSLVSFRRDFFFFKVIEMKVW